MATGVVLYFKAPFPTENIFLHVMAIRAPLVYQGTLYSYNLFLFTTPYIAYSMLLSVVYIAGPRFRKRLCKMKLPTYPDPSQCGELFLIVGEVHNPRKRLPSAEPYWLTILERGLFTGIAILGAIGSGKTKATSVCRSNERNCGARPSTTPWTEKMRFGLCPESNSDAPAETHERPGAVVRRDSANRTGFKPCDAGKCSSCIRIVGTIEREPY